MSLWDFTLNPIATTLSITISFSIDVGYLGAIRTYITGAGKRRNMDNSIIDYVSGLHTISDRLQNNMLI